MADPITVPAAPTHFADQFTQKVGESTDALHRAFNEFVYNGSAFLLKLIPALILLVVGYIIARFVARAMVSLCERFGLQRVVEHGELAQSMRQVGIQRTVPQIVGTISFWLLMFLFVMATFNLLGWNTSAMQTVFSYVPNILAAMVLIVVGLLVASLLRGFVATSADRAGLSYAQQLASGVYYVLAVVIFWTALHQFNIDTRLLDNLILIASGAAAVGFALAFGLGGRDVVGGILAGYYLRQRMQTGDHVQVAGMEGTVREVGPVSTIVETEEHGLLHRHSIPNTRMLNEAVR